MVKAGTPDACTVIVVSSVIVPVDELPQYAVGASYHAVAAVDPPGVVVAARAYVGATLPVLEFVLSFPVAVKT